MKILIWIVCIIIYSIIQVFIKNAGIILGAIPTVIMFSLMMATIRFLCKKYDEYCAKKDKSHIEKQRKIITAEIEDLTPSIPAASNTKEAFVDKVTTDTFVSKPNISSPTYPTISFCRKCGRKLLPDSDFCSYCGTVVIRGDAGQAPSTNQH